LLFCDFGRIEEGSVVTSNFWATNSATLSLGSGALFAARAAGMQAKTNNPLHRFILILLWLLNISARG
jgi:hypothetical protein